VAQTRPAAYDVIPPVLTCHHGGRSDADGPLLTRADARALRRSAATTHARLEEHFRALGPPALGVD
jgi:hypothetical protein